MSFRLRPLSGPRRFKQSNKGNGGYFPPPQDRRPDNAMIARQDKREPVSISSTTWYRWTHVQSPSGSRNFPCEFLSYPAIDGFADRTRCGWLLADARRRPVSRNYSIVAAACRQRTIPPRWGWGGALRRENHLLRTPEKPSEAAKDTFFPMSSIYLFGSHAAKQLPDHFGCHYAVSDTCTPILLRIQDFSAL